VSPRDELILLWLVGGAAVLLVVLPISLATFGDVVRFLAGSARGR
jgi:hypothetical protein